MALSSPLTSLVRENFYESLMVTLINIQLELNPRLHLTQVPSCSYSDSPMVSLSVSFPFFFLANPIVLVKKLLFSLFRLCDPPELRGRNVDPIRHCEQIFEVGAERMNLRRYRGRLEVKVEAELILSGH